MATLRSQLPAALAALVLAGTIGAAPLDAADAYRLSLLRLKAHLEVARTLIQLRAEGADYHLRQSMQEIFRRIEPELDERGAPLSADTLEQLERAAEAAPEVALATIDLAAAAIDGSFAQTGGLDAEASLALAASLLRSSVQLYREAVRDHAVTDLRKYRTGRGQILQAEALVRHTGELRRSPGHDELVAAVILVRQAWPGVDPPPIVFGPASVGERLDQALAIMARMR